MMGGRRWIIDDKGDIWPGSSGFLRQLLFCELSEPHFSQYLITNLGFIALHERDAGASIRLRPQVVSPLAVVGLAYWLSDRRIERVALSSLGSEWQHRIFASRQSCMQCLLSMVEREPPDHGQNFLSTSKSFAELRPGTPLDAIHRKWRTDPEVGDEDAFLADCQFRFRGRFTVTRPQDDRVVIHRIGPGYCSYNATWLSIAEGHPHEDGPDYRYGRWVAHAHHRVLNTSAPALDDVDAIIERPRGGPNRVCYTRLILPFRRRNGGIWLLSASTLDSRIDLRAERGKKPA
jgi:hypothetical protein